MRLAPHLPLPRECIGRLRHYGEPSSMRFRTSRYLHVRKFPAGTARSRNCTLRCICIHLRVTGTSGYVQRYDVAVFLNPPVDIFRWYPILWPSTVILSLFRSRLLYLVE